MDNPGSTQLPDGHRPARGFGQVPDQGSRRPAHRFIRRRPPGRRHPDPRQPAAGTPSDAICERIIGTLRRELPGQVLIINEHHLRQVLAEYLQHYNTARPHRALGQPAPDQAPIRPPQINLAEHRIRRKQVLSGLTSEYQIAA